MDRLTLTRLEAGSLTLEQVQQLQTLYTAAMPHGMSLFRFVEAILDRGPNGAAIYAAQCAPTHTLLGHLPTPPGRWFSFSLQA
jgi:hypothetical protein